MLCYKVRRGLDRFEAGYQAEGTVLCIPAACGVLDTIGHSCSFCYFLLDNLLWAASVGTLEESEGVRSLVQCVRASKFNY